MEPEMVGVAGCRRELDAAADDLYPDADAPPLRAALRALGARTALVSWDDPEVAWDRFSHVVVSSTWDSVDRPGEYLTWAHRVEEVSTLVNAARFIEWNLDKTHQRELHDSGVATIPTEWIGPSDGWRPPTTGDFVVKPSVSAGGRSTARYVAGDRAALDHVRALQDVGQTVMVQPYLEAIDTQGEINVVFFNGVFSHAVKKRPVLRAGQGLVERPWEQMKWDGIVAPRGAEMDVARAALGVVFDRLSGYPLYGRVDMVADPRGAPTILEMELIDPYLSLDLVPQAAARMAQAILGG